MTGKLGRNELERCIKKIIINSTLKMPKMLEFLDFKLFRGSTPSDPRALPFPPLPPNPAPLVRYFQVAFLFFILGHSTWSVIVRFYFEPNFLLIFFLFVCLLLWLFFLHVVGSFPCRFSLTGKPVIEVFGFLDFPCYSVELNKLKNCVVDVVKICVGDVLSESQIRGIVDSAVKEELQCMDGSLEIPTMPTANSPCSA